MINCTSSQFKDNIKKTNEETFANHLPDKKHVQNIERT